MPKKIADPQSRAEIGRTRRARTRARIIAAAFDLFGREGGLFVRIEDVARAADITRPTFYDHFKGMAELRDAVSYEVTHHFFTAVIAAVIKLDDPREQASAAMRLYLDRAREDPRWGWSTLNVSANGAIFGAETFRQAELTVRDGMAAGQFTVATSAAGRDSVLGAALAALSTILRQDPGQDYGAQMAEIMLRGLGVGAADAHEIATRPLPTLLPGDPETELDKVSK